MTTVELVQHLLPYCTFREVSEARAWEAQELALVMSQSVEKWFALAPAQHRRTTVTQLQEAPETIEVEITAGASTTIGAPFPTTKRGSTVFIGDDPRPNEITSPSTLLYAFAGTPGTVSAVIYHNCIAFPDFLVERVVTHPEVVTAMGSVYQMAPLSANSRTFRLPATPGACGVPPSAQVWTNRAETPSHYWMEAIGGSHQVENDGVFQLRVWPLPTSEFTVQMDAEILPLAYRIPALETPLDLPVPDSMAHRTFIPLARGILTDSPVFNDDRFAASVTRLKRAQLEAEQSIKDLAATWIPSEMRSGTPQGW